MTSSDNIIELDDILLFDPFTLSAKAKLNNLGVKITSDEFFESFYCEPFFCQKNSSIFDVDDDELSHRLSDEEIKDLNAKKDFFEKCLYDSHELLHILGYSGSGKSIYLNYCLYKMKSKRQSFVFNLEESSSIIKGAGNTDVDIIFESKNVPNIAPWFFAGLLIEKTYKIITDILQIESQETIVGIQKQYKFLIDNEIGGNDTLFAAFKKIDDQSKIETKREIFNELKALMRRSSGENDIKSIIQRILEVLTKFLFCYTEAQKSIKGENINGYILAFDNIEHYIRRPTIIFDEDIVSISTTIELFISSAKKEYEKINKVFSDYFKFILAIRDTTVKFLSTTVHGDISYGNVDVSSWYVFKEIQSKKESILGRINFDKTEKARESLAVLKVIADDNNGAGQSFNILFSEMYNHNKRRTVRILNKVIRKMTELGYENKKLITLATFQSYWSEPPAVYKYLCRRAIIRLILDFIGFDSIDAQESSFFNKIHVNHGEKEIGTYARRVLCFLLYKSHGKIDEKYVSFYNIIKGIFDPPGNNEIEIDVFNELAEILLVMNESSFVEYNWVQLIVIKFNATSTITKDELAKKLKESYEKKIETDDKFGIRITNAGRFFAYIQSDFEYFSSRYCKNIAAFSPLIWVKDMDAIKKIIETVFVNAKKCINAVIASEKNYFRDYKKMYHKEYFYKWTLLGREKAKMPHPYRIIDTHCSYLDHYKNFLEAEKKKKKPSVFSDSDIEELQKYANEYIAKYKEIFSNLEKEKDAQQNNYFCLLDNSLPQHRVKEK
ncbi:MAG: hypothetical protein LBG10_07470 [Treponema sp.]|jgi:hypothetical protein|nr:hypothetical protein [Treponema sp.]